MNNINFKGYSNIISAHNIVANNLRTTYIALKLDDNGEFKDLTKYKQIRKLMGYPKGLENEDVLTLTYVTNGITEDLYFNEKGLCWGEQLLNVRENFVPRVFNQNEYNKYESLHIKIYTFLADITKRMANDKFENEDEGMKSVIKSIFTNLKKIHKGIFLLFDQQDAFELTSVGALKQDKFQKTAKRLNLKILETMTEFFR